MTAKIVVAGCRDFTDYDMAEQYIDFCIQNLKDKEIIIISGCCRGADALGERYANEHGYKIDYFPADWNTYRNSAGPRRNEQMVTAADYVIAFWDGKSKGTRSLINYAKAKNKPLRVKRI